jgi:hypothetical protein
LKIFKLFKKLFTLVKGTSDLVNEQSMKLVTLVNGNSVLVNRQCEKLINLVMEQMHGLG